MIDLQATPPVHDRRRNWLHTYPDGSELLLETRYEPETGRIICEVSTRQNHSATWSPPTRLREVDS